MNEGGTSIRLMAVAYGLPEGEVEAILGLMPAEYREALLATFGDTHKGAASTLGVSVSTLKVRAQCGQLFMRGAVLSSHRHPPPSASLNENGSHAHTWSNFRVHQSPLRSMKPERESPFSKHGHRPEEPTK